MLRNRIFLVIGIGLVPIIVTVFLGVAAVNDSHRADVARLEAAVLTQKAQELDNFLRGQLFAQTSVIVTHPSGTDTSLALQALLLSQRLAVLPYLNSLSFIGLTGRESVHMDRAYPQGYPSSSLRDLSASPEFTTARTGAQYLGPVVYTPAGPVVSFATPFKNQPGEVIGVIVGEANLHQVQELTAQAQIGETGYLYLVDSKGLVIGGGGPFAAGGAVGGEAQVAAGSASVANLPMISRVLNGEDRLTAATQAQYKNVKGEQVVAAAKYLPAYNWGLVAEWPAAEANALVNTIFTRNALALAGVMLIALALSLWLAAHIVRPLKKLQESAARVAEGHFNEGVYIRTGDELQALGDSFNSMVQGLKQLEELKDEFVFIAAHELRTPVAAMKGYLTLILEGNTGVITPATKAYVEKVIASDNRLVQLVNDLLEVARSQAGRLTIKVAEVELGPPIRAVLDELQSLADEKAVKLLYDPPADMPKVLADSDRIKEVMVNLVGNAIKYMGGAGTVTITHEVKDGEVATNVADTGLGMSAEAQRKLFEKFYRVQTDKTREITGTGLGLFIVRQIIEKMNGKIGVRSEEGKGSIFSFSLPANGPGPGRRGV